MKVVGAGLLLARSAGEAVLLVLFAVAALPVALVSRAVRRPVDVGLGPEPLINNVYHKKALSLFGYSAETFVDHVYYITDEFDVRADRSLPGRLGPLRSYYLFFRALFRYRCLYLYFNGGPLFARPLVWRVEPHLYRVAGVRVVVMPYGSDVDEMSRSRNLLFKHAQSRDYPGHRHRRRRISDRIDLWTRWAGHVIGGVDWVDYLYHWDTLMLGHFSIDVDRVAAIAQEVGGAEIAAGSAPTGGEDRGSASTATGGDAESGGGGLPGSRTLRVLHAPNHKAIKGTAYFERAVTELQEEGVDIELVVAQGLPNEELIRAIAAADVVADQLVVGWYAMFALEAMSAGRPVLCYLRDDLLHLYTAAGLLEPGEVPIVSCGPLEVKAALRGLAADPARREELGGRGREYVRRHHSLEAVGMVFDRINRAMGITPSGSPVGAT